MPARSGGLLRGEFSRRTLMSAGAAATGVALMSAFGVLASGDTPAYAADDVQYQYPFPIEWYDDKDPFGNTSPPWRTPSTPHRGADFNKYAAGVSGTAIPAIANGSVVFNDWVDELGWVITISHADGAFSGYCHMQSRSPLGTGTAVTRGQIVGQVGGTRSSSQSYAPHLHLTMAWDSAGTRGGASRFDPISYIGARLTAPQNPAPTVIEPVALILKSGLIALYAVRADGQLWGTNQLVAGGAFNPWSVIGTDGGNLRGRASVLQLPSGQIVAYARTAAGIVVGAGQSSAGGAFSSWSPIGSAGNGIASDPTAILLENGIIAVYAATDAGTLSGTNQTVPGGAFSAWSTIGSGSPQLIGRPAVLQLPTGQIVAYGLSTAGMIYGSGQGAPGGSFSAWGAMGTDGNGVTSVPTATFADGKITLFAGTSAGTVAYTTQISAGSAFDVWKPTGPTPATLVGSPAVLVTSSGETVVYARGSDSQTYGTTLLGAAHAPTAWSVIGTGGGGVVVSPTVVETPSKVLAVYSSTDSAVVVGSGQAAPGGSFGGWGAI